MRTKPSRLRVPAALAVATLGTATTIAVAASCGGDDPPKDANSCAVFCAGGLSDAGPEPDGGCPMCASFENGAYTCPVGCTPLG